jgi:hypothetical protein
MAQVVELLWRAVTAADFFNIERKREKGPTGGGGQTYISISFRGLTHTELGPHDHARRCRTSPWSTTRPSPQS